MSPFTYNTSLSIVSSPPIIKLSDIVCVFVLISSLHDIFPFIVNKLPIKTSFTDKSFKKVDEVTYRFAFIERSLVTKTLLCT